MKPRLSAVLPCLVCFQAARAFDCDGDGVNDFDAGGPLEDCDANGQSDACDLARHFVLGAAVFEDSRVQSFLAADFDADGDVDLGVSARSQGGYLLLNDGAGRFPSIRPVPHDLGHLVLLGDIDGDGDTDLITPVFGGVRTLLNRGDADFSLGLFTETRGRTVVGLEDLDADGDMDMAGAKTSPPGRGLAAWLQEGGAFLEQKLIGPSLVVSSVCFDDLDGDGRTDLGVATDFDVLVFLNRDLPLELPGRNALGSRPLAIASGDVDMDGDRDLVTVNVVSDELPANLSVLANDGTGSYSVPRNYLASVNPLHARLADLDGDRDLDVIGISQDQHGVTAIWNEGDRAFRVEEIWRSPFRVHVLDAVDLDGDGDLDIPVSLGSKGHGWILVLWNLGAGRFQALPFESEAEAIETLSAGDLDGDGDIDLAYAGSGPANPVWLRNEGELRRENVGAVSEDPHDLIAADLDADGDLDLAMTAGRLHLFSNDGLGRFEPVVRGEPWSRSLAHADFDGDGLVDLAANGESSIDVARNEGGWSFARPERHDVGPFPECLVAVESTGDGRVDLIVTGGRPQEERLWVLRNLGDGSFAPFESRIDVTARHMDAGDLDLDGDTDLVLGDSLQGGIAVFDGSGDGGFEYPRRSGSELTGPLILHDLDRDGDPDLAAALQEERLGLRFNAGDGSFPQALIESAGKVLDIAAADLDGDGDPDLALGRDARGLLVLENHMDGSSRDCNGNGAPDTCDISAGVLHDMDGDGLADDCVRVPFTRGDVNLSGEVNITDAIRTLDWLFTGGEPPACRSSADTDDSASVELTDAIYLLRFLFLAGDPPLPPFPGCGTDSTLDALGCDSARNCPV